MPQDRVLTRQFLFLCLTNFFFFVTVYSFLVTLPVYSVVLGGGEGQAGWVTAAINLTAFLALPHLGRQANRFGRTPFLHIGPALLLGEALVLPYVSWFPLMVPIGVACGGALALVQTGGGTLVADLAPIHRRGEAMGIFGTFTTMAVALSPALSTFMMRSSGFPALFSMSAVLATITLLLSFLVKEPLRRAEASANSPLLHPRALLPAFGIFAITLTYGTLISFLPGRAPKIGLENVGLFFTVFAISSLLVRALAGTLSDRLGRVPVILPALFLVAAAMLLLGQSSGPATALGVAFLYGLGYGSAHPTIMALAVDRAGPGERASAVATFNASYNLGMATGSLAMGLLLESTSFAVMAAVAGAAPLLAFAALSLVRSPGRSATV